MEVAANMIPIQTFLVLYLAVATLAIWVSVTLTRRFTSRSVGRLIVAAVVAVFFAPGIVGIGHGGVILVPAWMSAIESAGRGYWKGFWLYDIGSILLAWIILFIILLLPGALTRSSRS
jgi:hypothetical protein